MKTGKYMCFSPVGGDWTATSNIGTSNHGLSSRTKYNIITREAAALSIEITEVVNASLGVTWRNSSTAVVVADPFPSGDEFTLACRERERNGLYFRVIGYLFQLYPRKDLWR